MSTNETIMNLFEAEIIDIKGHCNAGHIKGEKVSLNCYQTGGLCGFFYHDIFPTLSVLQFGGRYPWEDNGFLVLECPDRTNAVTLRIGTAGSKEK